jgi:hypothetical protein
VVDTLDARGRSQGNCDEDIAELRRTDAKQIAAEHTGRFWTPEAARLPWVTSAYRGCHLMDAAQDQIALSDQERGDTLTLAAG